MKSKPCIVHCIATHIRIIQLYILFNVVCKHCIHCFSQRIVLHFRLHPRTHSNANKGRVNVNDSFALCMSNDKESMEIRKPALMLRIQFSPIHDDINQTEQFIFIIIVNYNELTQLKIINFPPVFFLLVFDSSLSPVDLVWD